MEDESVKLEQYLRILYKRRKLFIFSFLILFFTGNLFIFLLREEYSAGFSCIIEENRLSGQELEKNYTEKQETYRNILTSLKMFRQVSQVLNKKISYEKYLKRIKIETPKNTRLLIVVIRNEDKIEAYEVAVAMFKIFLSESRKIQKKEIMEICNLTGREYNEAKEALNEAETKLREHIVKNKIGALEKQLEVLGKLEEKLRVEKVVSETELAKKNNEIEEWNSLALKYPPLLSGTVSVLLDSGASNITRETTGLKEMRNLNFTNQMPNTAYSEINVSMARSKTERSGLIAGLQALEKKLKNIQEERDSLTVFLSDLNLTKSILEREYNMKKDYYIKCEETYKKAKLYESLSKEDISLFEEPVIPEYPEDMSGTRKTIILMSFVLSLIIAMILPVVVEYTSSLNFS